MMDPESSMFVEVSYRRGLYLATETRLNMAKTNCLTLWCVECGKESELEFTLHEKRGRRAPPFCICDLDYADDIVLISDQIEQAKKLLHQVEVPR